MSVRAILLDQVLRRLVSSSTPEEAEREVRRRVLEGCPPPAPVPAAVSRRCRVEEHHRDGRRVVHLLPRAAEPRGTLVLLHGGGFAHPVTGGHWSFAGRVVRATGLEVVVPLYRLAPQGTARTEVAFAGDVLADLVSQRPRHTVSLAGDSAGAGLALAAAASDDRLRDLRQLLLLSPWVDLAASDPAVAALAPHDVILDPDELAVWGRAWAGDLPLDDPRVSPVRADLTGLPPVHVITGGRDALLPDALRLHREVLTAGGAGSLLYAPDANHAVGLLGPVVPEGRRAWQRVVELLQPAPDRTPGSAAPAPVSGERA